MLYLYYNINIIIQIEFLYTWLCNDFSNEGLVNTQLSTSIIILCPHRWGSEHVSIYMQCTHKMYTCWFDMMGGVIVIWPCMGEAQGLQITV